jgi:site-specific DNA-cytosine methylase
MQQNTAAVTPAPRPLRAVGAYIYAGGFTVGVRRAGFEVNVHLEDPKPYGGKTAVANLGVELRPWPWQLEDLRGTELVYANPPCKAFSVMGKMVRSGRDAWRTHPALQCTANVVSLLDRVNPRMLLWESVTGSITTATDLIRDLGFYIRERGYAFTVIMHNAYNHGSNQNRQRVIYVAHRDTLHVPEGHYDRKHTIMDTLTPLKDALRVSCFTDEDKLMKKFGYLMPDIVPGQDLRWTFHNKSLAMEKEGIKRETHAKHGYVIGRPSIAFGVRPRATGPCNVVCKSAFVHPKENRFLSLTEMTALSDFPPDYDWQVKRPEEAVLEMARGVSPCVGEWVGEMAKATLRGRSTGVQYCSFPGASPVDTAGARFSYVDLRMPPELRRSRDLAHFLRVRRLPLDYFDARQLTIPGTPPINGCPASAEPAVEVTADPATATAATPGDVVTA